MFSFEKKMSKWANEQSIANFFSKKAIFLKRLYFWAAYHLIIFAASNSLFIKKNIIRFVFTFFKKRKQIAYVHLKVFYPLQLEVMLDVRRIWTT